MGNQQGIPEDVKAKFATCELEQMEKIFSELAKAGSIRGKTFDKKTFVKMHFPNSPDLGGSIFDAMDRSRDGKISIDEFFLALSLLCRGGTKDKFKYIFIMVVVTCGTGQQRVSSNDLYKFLTMSFFQPKQMAKKSFEMKVKENVQSYFQEYDKDKDKFLNFNEFSDFASNSFEITLILDVFLNLEKKFITSSTDSISGPMDVKHETHVERTEGGGISIDNIPPSWLQLFREAGIKKKELSDPKTAFMLMEIIAKKLGEKSQKVSAASISAVDQSSSSSSLPSYQSSSSSSSSQPSLNTPQSTQPQYNAIPAAVVSSNAPAPPPPPPAPSSSHSSAPPPPPVVHSSSSHQKTNAAPIADTSNLLSQIKQGTKLKPAAEIEVDKLSKEDRNDITSALVDAIKMHRVSMNESDDEDNNDDWD